MSKLVIFGGSGVGKTVLFKHIRHTNSGYGDAAAGPIT